MAYITQCDKCGMQAEPASIQGIPAGWAAIRLQVTGVQSHHFNGRSQIICHECLRKYKLDPKPDNEGRETNRDKLWDIMLDLAEEAQESI